MFPVNPVVGLPTVVYWGLGPQGFSLLPPPAVPLRSAGRRGSSLILSTTAGFFCSCHSMSAESVESAELDWLLPPDAESDESSDAPSEEPVDESSSSSDTLPLETA